MQVSLDALKKWTTPTYFQEGKSWFEDGKVEHFIEKDGEFEGRISIRDRAQITRFTVENQVRPPERGGERRGLGSDTEVHVMRCRRPPANRSLRR